MTEMNRIENSPVVAKTSQNNPEKSAPVSPQILQRTTSSTLPTDVDNPKTHGASKTSWKEKMGVAPKSRGGDALQTQSSLPKKSPTKKQESGPGDDKKEGDTEDRSLARKDSFDIHDLLGDVVKSNSRSKFYTGNTSKRFDG